MRHRYSVFSSLLLYHFLAGLSPDLFCLELFGLLGRFFGLGRWRLFELGGGFLFGRCLLFLVIFSLPAERSLGIMTP